MRTVFVQCPTCKGNKKIKDKLCSVCLGAGEIPSTTAEDLKLNDREQVSTLSIT